MGQPLSWSTIGYMVGEVQYGGRITDDLDREVRSRARPALFEPCAPCVDIREKSIPRADTLLLHPRREVLCSSLCVSPQMFNTYTSKWLTDDLFKSGFCFNSASTNSHEFIYKVPQGSDISVFRDYINALPYVDQPGVFGLHVNADLTFRLQESAYMLETIQVQETPRSSATLVKRT